MLLESPVPGSPLRQLSAPPPDVELGPIELIVDGKIRPLCPHNRVLLASGRSWRGYRLARVRIPDVGMLHRVSMPHHRIFFVARGHCDVRYRDAAGDARHQLSVGSFCFLSREHEFERIGWKASRLEAIVVDITDLGADPNPIDAFGRTDAFFDVYVGAEDTRVAALLDLMRSEIEAGCPTGSAYAEALSLALASRVACLCASAPCSERRVGVLSRKQLARITDHVAKNVSDNLTIDRLAALANMSPFHFARCFKHTTAMTPHQFVTRERILRARKMLASTDQPIGDIAMSLGFASQSHFADVYRKVTGRTPRRDRSGS
jgi:AraC family transcriptional regulator